jgi:hypothetical protein
MGSEDGGLRIADGTGAFCRPWRDSRHWGALFPALKRWAIAGFERDRIDNELATASPSFGGHDHEHDCPVRRGLLRYAVNFDQGSAGRVTGSANNGRVVAARQGGVDGGLAGIRRSQATRRYFLLLSVLPVVV